MAKKVAAAGPIQGPWALPDGWRWEQLGALGEFLNGAAFKPSDWGDEGIPIIRIQNLNNPDRVMNRTKRTVNERLLVRDGDLLVSWSATLDAFVWRREDAWLNQHIFKVIPDEAVVDRQYLFFLLKNEIENLKKTEHLHGSTMMHINRGPFLAHPVPVPPREVQASVAARIDELFAEIDNGEAALARARDDLATWRKALLKAAVTGELTADWRAANPSAESGAELLARVAADLPPRKPRKPGVPSCAGEPIAMPFTVPSCWVWTTLDQIINSGPTNGYSPKRSTDGKGTQALKLTATTAGRLKLDSNCVKVLSETIPAGSPLYLNSGDLLFQRGNTREYVGMAAVYDGPPNTYIYPDLMIRVTLPDEALTQWVWRWAVSPHGRHYLMDAAQGGAGTMPKISGQTLRSMPVPLPPATELKFILAELERLTAEAEAGHDDLHLASVTPAALRQSILAAAFRGELA